MKVLMVNQYFPPDTSATAAVVWDLACAFRKRGHSVTVIAGRPSYGPAATSRWRLWYRRVEEGITVWTVGSTSFDRRAIGGRVLNYVSFGFLAAARAFFVKSRDVVVCGSDPPLSVWSARLGTRGAPLVYFIQDLHPEFAIVAGMMNSGRLGRFLEWIHRKALFQCDRIVCLGEEMRTRIHGKGVPLDKVVATVPGAPAPTGPPDHETVSELRQGATFVAMHAGNIGGAGAWETLEEVGGLLEQKDVSLLFVGGGFRESALPGTRLVPFLPKDKLPSVMEAGHVQLVSLRRGMEGLVLPSKLFTAISHGRPVLALTAEGSDLARLVEGLGVGIVASPDDPVEVAEKLLWMKSHPEDLLMMEVAARTVAPSFYREKLLDELAQQVEEVVAGTR